MKLSVVTDEVSNDLETAIELISDWGLNYVELRGIGTQRVGQLDSFGQDQLFKTVKQSGIKVVALSPGVFKISLPQSFSELAGLLSWHARTEFYEYERQKELVERHLTELLPNTIALAEKLDLQRILVFGFIKPVGTKAEYPPAVVDYLGQAAKLAEKAGVVLALENEHVCWADTALNTKKVIEQVGSPALRLNWDPANAYIANEMPFPHGYQLIKDLVAHVHFKDVVTNPVTGEKRCAVDGEIDWNGQLKALQNDGYQGFLSIETHCKPKIMSTKECLERVLGVLGRGVLGI